MSAPLVSIITPTIASRRDMLVERCMPSVEAQTYPDVEHIIVSDGWDMAFEHVEDDLRKCRYFQLGRNMRQFYGNTWGAYPRMVGTHLARGAYIGYVDDDDELLPDHVAKLVALLESTGSDFVHSLFKREVKDGPPIIVGDVIEPGRIGTPCVLHKIECIKTRNWGWGGDFEDYELFKSWKDQGLKSAHLPEITIHVHK